MLGEFLNWMFGEDAEATANDATVNQVLVNSQKSRKRNTQRSSPYWSPSFISYFFLTRLLRSAPEESSK